MTAMELPAAPVPSPVAIMPEAASTGNAYVAQETGTLALADYTARQGCRGAGGVRG